jgi:phosphate acetyltransferase
MAKNAYVIEIDRHAEKSWISLGLLSALTNTFEKCAFFKPIADINPETGQDLSIDLMKRYFKLPFPKKALSAFSTEKMEELSAKGNLNELLNTTLRRYKSLEKQADFVLCQASDYTLSATSFGFDTHVKIANNLGAPLILVANAHDKTMKQLTQHIDTALNNIEKLQGTALALIVNKIDPTQETAIKKLLNQHFKGRVSFVATMPESPGLSTPSVADIAQKIKGKIIFGQEQSGRLVSNYTIAAKQVREFLSANHSRTDMLIITPGTREDLLLSCLLADQSANYPKIAGILLTTGEEPAKPIQKIISGLHAPFPVITTKLDSFEAATTLDNADYRITIDHPQRIQAVIDYFYHHVDIQQLIEITTQSQSHLMTPQMFSYHLVEKARTDKKHIVLPEGEDPRILAAAHYLLQRDIVDITLLGNEQTIKHFTAKHALDVSKATIIDPKTAKTQRDDFAKRYYTLRKHRGVNLPIAKECMEDVNYFGTMMVHEGLCDGLVSGATHITRQTILPALQVIKTKPGYKLASSIFLMCLADRVLVYGDCAVIPDPDAEALAEIAIAAAENAKQFGITPYVAMLSYSSGDSGIGEDVEKVKQATAIVKSRAPDLMVDGPIQYDAAVDPTVAQQKMPNSPVAGRASVLIFPDLNTGNNTYKAVQRETKALAIGPIIQGLKKPVNDLSRGCTVADVINTIIITAIQAQQEES